MANPAAAQRPADRPRALVGAVRRPAVDAPDRQRTSGQRIGIRRGFAHRAVARRPCGSGGGAGSIGQRRCRRRAQNQQHRRPQPRHPPERRPERRLGAGPVRRQRGGSQRGPGALRRRATAMARGACVGGCRSSDAVHQPARLRGAIGAGAARHRLAQRNRAADRAQREGRLPGAGQCRAQPRECGAGQQPVDAASRTVQQPGEGTGRVDGHRRACAAQRAGRAKRRDRPARRHRRAGSAGGAAAPAARPRQRRA